MNRKPILILGAAGMLGSDLVRVFSEEQPIAWDRAEIDIADQQDVIQKISKLKPWVIINAAAYNAVDACETSQEEKQKAFAINGTALEVLSKAANRVGAILVHYSTDYVFDGTSSSPYAEDATPNPLSIYGKSKLAGEQAVYAMANHFIILRLSRLFGRPTVRQLGKKSFVEMILQKAKELQEIQVVDDECSSPTYSLDLAQLTRQMLKKNLQNGIYHAANEGACTWAEFAKEILNIEKISTRIIPVPSSAFPRPAPRPPFSQLKNTKLSKQRPWQDALKEFLQQKIWTSNVNPSSARFCDAIY